MNIFQIQKYFHKIKVKQFHCDTLSVFCKKIIIFCCHEKKALDILLGMCDVSWHFCDSSDGVMKIFWRERSYYFSQNLQFQNIFSFTLPKNRECNITIIFFKSWNFTWDVKLIHTIITSSFYVQIAHFFPVIFLCAEKQILIVHTKKVRH